MRGADTGLKGILSIAPFSHRLFPYAPSLMSFDSAWILKSAETKGVFVFVSVGNSFAYPWAGWKGF
jgi:hypothetical protein